MAHLAIRPPHQHRHDPGVAMSYNTMLLTAAILTIVNTVLLLIVGITALVIG